MIDNNSFMENGYTKKSDRSAIPVSSKKVSARIVAPRHINQNEHSPFIPNSNNMRDKQVNITSPQDQSSSSSFLKLPRRIPQRNAIPEQAAHERLQGLRVPRSLLPIIGDYQKPTQQIFDIAKEIAKLQNTANEIKSEASKIENDLARCKKKIIRNKQKQSEVLEKIKIFENHASLINNADSSSVLGFLNDRDNLNKSKKNPSYKTQKYNNDELLDLGSSDSDSDEIIDKHYSNKSKKNPSDKAPDNNDDLLDLDHLLATPEEVMQRNLLVKLRDDNGLLWQSKQEMKFRLENINSKRQTIDSDLQNSSKRLKKLKEQQKEERPKTRLRDPSLVSKNNGRRY